MVRLKARRLLETPLKKQLDPQSLSPNPSCRQPEVYFQKKVKGKRQVLGQTWLIKNRTTTSVGSYGQMHMLMLARLVIASAVVSYKVHNLYLETEARRSYTVEKRSDSIVCSLNTVLLPTKAPFCPFRRNSGGCPTRLLLSAFYLGF